MTGETVPQPATKTLTIPDFSLVVLVGPSGAGKSTFARRWFQPTEILSSDAMRAWVDDDENSLDATGDAFAVLHYLARKRLARRRLVVVDATNVQPESRRPLMEIAREYHAVPVAIVLDVPEKVCLERNRGRAERAGLGAHVVRNHCRDLRRSLKYLAREGFRQVHVLDGLEEVEAAVVERQPLWTDRRGETGPFDIIGDVHGCCDELEELLDRLGYRPDAQGVYRHPEGRRVIFLGDLVDRGPRSLDTLRLAMAMVEGGSALAVPGNHDMKFLRWVRGRNVQVTQGLDRTIAEVEGLPPGERESFLEKAAAFIDGLVSHYWLDDGRLVVAHAGMKESYQGRASRAVREFALYGETTGEIDEYGLPVRLNWAAEYRGKARVVYGHTPVPEAEWLNHTINIDTGCVFGGRLTALRYPERELVQVPAHRVYAEPARPFFPETEGRGPAADGQVSLQQAHDALLRAEDVLGKRILTTRLARTVTVPAEHAAAALEVMSRFAVDPRWLITLPPTMSPCETTPPDAPRSSFLEHPVEALAYYKKHGVGQVVCQEKHMGSRAIIIVCRDAGVARDRFGVTTGEIGECYSRTGRRFFGDQAVHHAFLNRVAAALTEAGFWKRFATDWFCLDAEILPWNVKAQALLQERYAPVGAGGRAALGAALEAARQTAARGVNLGGLPERLGRRLDCLDRYVEAYRRYCWTTKGLSGVRVAPFHLLASEGRVHVDRNHVWHMEVLSDLCRAGGDLFLTTQHRVVNLLDDADVEACVTWWLDLTERGGEGMVAKPLDFIVQGRRGLVQPAVKCRGREYLRIIYGPEYTMPEHLERLRARGLSTKRSLALREFALGIEALERFVRREPLRRVHECVFGVLALESEPVDPRL